jgi:hypothetical protein
VENFHSKLMLCGWVAFDSVFVMNWLNILFSPVLYIETQYIIGVLSFAKYIRNGNTKGRVHRNPVKSEIARLHGRNGFRKLSFW